MKNSVTNTSGIHVKGNKLLVKPREIDTVTKSGIVLVQDTTEKEAMADMFGVVVDIGAMCWIDETERRCEVGDFIIHARYAGELFRGDDGVRYRLINARDVIATKDNPTVGDTKTVEQVKEAA